MKHGEINTGMLRAYIDSEGSAGTISAIAEHVAVCDACDAELKTLRGRAASVHAGMDDLPQAARAEDAAAWDALRERFNATRAPGRIFWTPMRAWSLAAAGAVAIAAVLVITVAPVRGWAESLLSIFRVEHVTVLDLNSGSIKGLENNEVFNQAMTRLLSEQVTVTQAPQKPQPVADRSAASRMAGFEVRLFAGEKPATLMVGSAITAQMKLDRERLQSILDEAGRSDLLIPRSVDGAVIGLRVPAGVLATYGNCGDLMARWRGENAASSAAPPADNTCVKLDEMPSPTASVPEEMNPAEIAQVGLQFAGLSATEAANFTQTVDWTTTLVMPVLHGQTTYEKVNINGIEAVLLRPRLEGPSGRFNLVWVDNGMVFNLMGTGDDITARNLASRIE